MVKWFMEYRVNRFALNKWGRFRMRDAESDFMEHDRTDSLPTVRTFLLVMGIIFALFIISDYHFYSDRESFPAAFGFRGAGLLIALAAYFLIGKFARYEHTLVMVSLTQAAVFALYLLNVYVLDCDHTDLQFMTVTLFILSVFLIPNVWENCIIAGSVILAAYLIFRAAFLHPGELPLLTVQAIYLSICFFCCAIFIYGREKTRRKQFTAEKLLEHMSVTDALTGINNRAQFEHILGSWIKSNRNNPFSLILFDIDDFKKVNDRFGHTAGDQVLVKTAEAVTAHIRDEDVFARWGGEEFVILFRRTGIEMAADMAERLRQAVEVNPCAEAGNVTISIGVAEYRMGESITGFVNRADEKMYEAKRAGKNQVMA